MQSNLAGKISEFVARSLFRLKGYRIVCKNYITGRGTNAGEVDFIASKGKNLVFVEVKHRKNIEDALYAISDKQQRRLLKAAEAFMQKKPIYSDYNIRFDAVFVSLPYRLKHIKDAWR